MWELKQTLYWQRWDMVNVIYHVKTDFKLPVLMWSKNKTCKKKMLEIARVMIWDEGEVCSTSVAECEWFCWVIPPLVQEQWEESWWSFWPGLGANTEEKLNHPRFVELNYQPGGTEVWMPSQLELSLEFDNNIVVKMAEGLTDRVPILHIWFTFNWLNTSLDHKTHGPFGEYVCARFSTLLKYSMCIL